MFIMRSLKYKLLFSILPLCLGSLLTISFFSYYQAKRRITQDRIELFLEQIARDIESNIRLSLLEKEEETMSMSLYGAFRDYLLRRTPVVPQALLDQLVVVHEVYDVLALFDAEGNLVLTNSIDRRRIERPLDPSLLKAIRGQSLLKHTPEASWLQRVRSGRFAYLDWHHSTLVHELYDYAGEDLARHYSIGFAAPIFDRRGVMVGGVLALMNWEYIQEIFDKVEEDLQERSLPSGYGFLFGTDRNTVLAHKYRRNRSYPLDQLSDLTRTLSNYGTRLTEDHELGNLQRELVTGVTNSRYEYPPGTEKIAGWAFLDHPYFQWLIGVGINNEHIFAPVQTLKEVLIVTASASALLVVFLTYLLARGITTPLKKLMAVAGQISSGDLSQRVEISARDEVGELARSFNEMAESLQERSQALLELNRSLEEKVQERTRELEKTNREVKKAYQELQETQVQLVQSEKMASLGQLVAGIAHEIKNPLNFIYGNTDFLKRYVQDLKQLLQFYEGKARLDEEALRAVESLKKEIHYSFMLQDLDTLVRNFEEGAKRIHSIIADLRTFSRMDSGDRLERVDIREPLELALNLLQNQYRERISIHKEYGEVPQVLCNSGKMSQVFMNLISNACQAISEKGDIWIRTFSLDGSAIIEIEDNGAGIEQEHLDKVFEPFFTTKPVGKGTGLGLSISYGIIQQHQGIIEVESEKGKQTKFRIRLPL